MDPSATVQRLKIEDHELYVEQYGPENGSNLILLHHGLGSTRSWRHQIAFFAAAGWRVTVIDRWGYGRSAPRPVFEPGYLFQDTQETLRVLNLLSIERTCVIGHSDGGTIALILAADHPERIEALVVVAAHIYFESKMQSRLETIQRALQRPPLKTALDWEHGKRAQKLIESWLHHWQNSDLSELSLLDRLPDIKAPTLVIQGELDEHATPQHAIDIAEGVQDGELWLIPAVYHMPPLEIPVEFNQCVLDFLRFKATLAEQGTGV
jgi:pimeloyl-ACP methyl ester carboxylesterase